MGGAQEGMCPPKNYCIILCSTILLPAMYGSRYIYKTVMTHVPPLSFNPTDAYGGSHIIFGHIQLKFEIQRSINMLGTC